MPTTTRPLSPAMLALLGQCRRAVGGTIGRTPANRPTIAALERRGLVTVAGHDPTTWAASRRARQWYATITAAGREALA